MTANSMGPDSRQHDSSAHEHKNLTWEEAHHDSRPLT